MAKVELKNPLASLRGTLLSSDPYYFRRYPVAGGKMMQIAQARPNRKGHIASEAEKETRVTFGDKYGRQRHEDYIEKIYKNQLKIDFENTQA